MFLNHTYIYFLTFVYIVSYEYLYYLCNIQNIVMIRARNESRILRVLLVSVPTCNRSLINHNRRVWQIKRIRSRRIIFHGDHQI